jgi:hypothetical protein
MVTTSVPSAWHVYDVVAPEAAQEPSVSVTVISPPAAAPAMIVVPSVGSAICAIGDGFLRGLTLATFSLVAFVGADAPRPLGVAATNVRVAASSFLLRTPRAWLVMWLATACDAGGAVCFRPCGVPPTLANTKVAATAASPAAAISRRLIRPPPALLGGC